MPPPSYCVQLFSFTVFMKLATHSIEGTQIPVYIASSLNPENQRDIEIAKLVPESRSGVYRIYFFIDIGVTLTNCHSFVELFHS